ncbi:MFS transporter [Paraburkholderia sp. RL17-337-BIB-A]|uniref:MFS transporter n=1 Tax=Paraburkholderia sp. RL17-337-BIB-A TaxID=3031636 RepID=UPI0038B9C40C
MERRDYVHRDIRGFFNDHPIGKQQWVVFILCFAATTTEGFDTIVMAFIAPAVSHEWHLPPAALAPLVAIGLFGLLLGSVIGGSLADRVGRKAVIIAAITWFGIAAIASSEAQSVVQLVLFRFVTGLGIGAAMPATSAFAAEYSPDRSRAAMLATIMCGILFGSAAAGFVTSFGIGVLGWRGMLALSGVLPLCVAGLFVWQVPESPLYLVASSKSNEVVKRVLTRVFPAVDCSGLYFVMGAPAGSKKGSLGLVGKDYRLGTVLTWITEFAGYLVFFLVGYWLPTHLKQSGLSMQEASQVSSMFQFGALTGAVLFVFLVRRINVASVICGSFAVGALLVVVLGLSEAASWLAGIIFLAGLATGGPLTCINTIPGIFYPTALRASGAGWTVAVGRVGSIIGSSLIGLIVISGYPFVLVCAVLSIPLVIASVCMAVMARILSAQHRLESEHLEAISSAPPDSALPDIPVH